jgi:hypothetical protein
MIHIPEVELAFSNACTMQCYICSPVHGGKNDPFMSQLVFDTAIERLKEVQFNMLQTGGDGESLLNPIYIDSLRTIRNIFPHVNVVLYNNFSMMTKDIVDILVEEQLIDNLYTRIDSLQPALFRQCTSFDFDTVVANIDYFLSKNNQSKNPITFQVNYSNIEGYFNKCRNVLGVDPIYWSPLLYDAPEDEFIQVQKRFKGAQKFSRITQSLWAERHNPALKAEPDLQCGRTYCFDTVLYIWTDGDVGLCGYDDGQDALIYGNILKESIPELWNCDAKQKRIDMVKNREIKGYPCINPKCCLFY